MPSTESGLQLLISTERVNKNTTDIDGLSTAVLLQRINQQDQTVPVMVEKAIPQIATLVDKIVEAFETGGRLFYVGAGTSGRLGVLDASECPPTFSTDPELVQGIIAGGDVALRNAVEGAEDNAEAGAQIISDNTISNHDVVVGISASGSAAYVQEALKQAKALGAATGCITTADNSPLLSQVDFPVLVDVGQEVLTGSTRLKSGTAQKLVLNMLTTGAMIQWGKTYGNLMVDVKPSNIKLKNRAIRLVSELGQCSLNEAEKLLSESNWQVKTAIIVSRFKLSPEAAGEKLQHNANKLRGLI